MITLGRKFRGNQSNATFDALLLLTSFQVNHVKLQAKWLPIITIIGAGKRIVMLTNFSFSPEFSPEFFFFSLILFNGRGHVTVLLGFKQKMFHEIE